MVNIAAGNSHRSAAGVVQIVPYINWLVGPVLWITYMFMVDRAKRDLTNAVYNHYLGLAWRDSYADQATPFGRQHILLTGEYYRHVV